MPKSRKSQKPTTTALERLREKVPDGPPFLGILLDEASMRCLAAGVVNARAEVAANKVLADFEAYTLQVEK